MDDNPEDLPQLVQRRLQERSKEEPFAADRLGKRPAPHWQRRWPGKRAGTYPAQLDNGEVFWVWFDPLREAQERDGVGIVDRTLGTLLHNTMTLYGAASVHHQGAPGGA
jgi:hypothetical protein